MTSFIMIFSIALIVAAMHIKVIGLPVDKMPENN